MTVTQQSAAANFGCQCSAVSPAMSAAMVTMDRAAMVLWLIPMTMVRRAIGNCRARSRCRPVVPSESEASRVFSGMPRMPCAVSRITGGAA